MSRKKYPSDLNQKQWEKIKPMVPEAKPGGRPAKYKRREIVNAILYLTRTGCAWRMLPHDLPPWRIVYYYFHKWRSLGIWKNIHDQLHRELREAEGREREPSAAIIDSQSVKTTQGAINKGYDAGKKIAGRKRHLIVDVLGIPLVVWVSTAGWQDCWAAKVAFYKLPEIARLKVIWADGGYAGKLVTWVAERFSWELNIVKKTQKGWEVLPRRWIVERTFSWLGKYRRLSKDYENRVEHSEAYIHIAMINLMSKRLARLQAF